MEWPVGNLSQQLRDRTRHRYTLLIFPSNNPARIHSRPFLFLCSTQQSTRKCQRVVEIAIIEAAFSQTFQADYPASGRFFSLFQIRKALVTFFVKNKQYIIRAEIKGV
jgi:hypothetical protein